MAESEGGNRHRFQSDASILKSTHVPVLPSVETSIAVPDASSSFYVALTDWRQLNLSTSFTAFADAVEPLSKTMHLLLHNWEEIIQTWLRVAKESEVDALEPLLDLLGKIVYDLRLTVLSLYDPILTQIIHLVNRKLSPSALQALLASLSSILKYLFVPTPELVPSTWRRIAEVFREGGETARLVAEVWGRTIRRLSADVRDALLPQMLDEPNVEFTVAVALVEAMKSPNHGHPPSAPALLRTVLRHLASTSSPMLPTTLKRVLTALLHHTTPVHFAPLMDALLDGRAYFDSQKLSVYLGILRVPFAVRRGARVQESHMKQISSQLASLPPSGEVVHLCTSVLVASNLAIWAGEGKKALDALWRKDDKSLALQIAQALCETEWKGYNTFITPYLIQHSRTLFTSYERQLLRLLGEMCRRGTFQDTREITGGTAFLESLTAWISDWPSSRAQWDEEQICDLYNAFAILPHLSSQPDLSPVLSRLMEIADPQQQWEATPANYAWGVAACLSHMSSSKPAPQIVSMIPSLIQRFSWNAQVMTGVADVVCSCSSPLDIALEKQALQSVLLSYSTAKRITALRILSFLPLPGSKEEKAVYRQCLEAEQVPLMVNKIRERILKVERVGGIEGANWLIAQLKVNLRPLWPAASQALAKLAQDNPGDVWSAILSQLEAVSLDSEILKEPQPRWTPLGDAAADVEQERTFRDPSLQKMDASIDRVMSSGVDRELIALIELQQSDDRLDVLNFEAQLLKTLALFPSLAEKNNRSLVTVLMHLVSDGTAEISSTRAVPRRVRSRLVHWLSLFSKFSNPRALYLWPSLQQLYLACLATPERQLQRLGVDCLTADSSSALRSYADKMSALLDDTKFRDELSFLNVSNMAEEERAVLTSAIIRLLYGIMTTRTAKSRARRRAILSSLTGCQPQELQTLVDLMLDPFADIRMGDVTGTLQFADAAPTASGKQQVGFLQLLGDVLTYLAPALRPMWPALVTVTMRLLHAAQRSISSSRSLSDVEPLPLEDDIETGSDPGEKESTQVPQYTVRQLGLKRLSDFFRRFDQFDFTPYMQPAFSSFISPRIPYLDTENTQAPSALLEMLHTWSERQETAMYLVQYDGRVIPKLLGCLTAVNVKPSVTSRVLDILDHLLIHASDNDAMADALIKPYIVAVVERLTDCVVGNGGNNVASDLVRRQIGLLSRFAPYMVDGTHAVRVLEIFIPLLRKTERIVPEKIKVDLLDVYTAVLPLVPDLSDPTSKSFSDVYDLLSTLFQSLKDRQARLSLVSAFQGLASLHTEYAVLSDLIASLNSFSAKRSEEPDFDRRLEAFSRVNETHFETLTLRGWLPILCNALFFVQEPDELSIRSNAALTIKRFIDVTSARRSPELERMFTRVAYPGIRKGLKLKSELVRAEVVGILGHAAATCEFSLSLREMRPLLAGGDDEANVFNNLFHIQTHRRTRALRRLVEHVKAESMSSSVLNDVFVPLVGHFIMDAPNVDHTLVHEATVTLGKLAQRLTWSSYNGLVRRYLKLARQKTAQERIYIRTVIAVLENFSFSLDEQAAVEQASLEQVDPDDIDEDADPTEQAVLVAVDADNTAAEKAAVSSQLHRILDLVTHRLLPGLLSYLESKDDTEDQIRIPIAYGIVCVAQKLPESSQRAEITRLLTVLCQIFRSRSHDTRLLARETLTKITVALGGDYFPMIIHELRSALLRGPQLHVLAFVTHALLVHVTQPEHIERFSNMDKSASDVAHLSSEVIFGQSGKDVMDEGFRTTFREVRSSGSKALDAFQIMSRLISASHVRDLLFPLRRILETTDTQKTLQLVDDVLHRIAGGLNANTHLSPADILALCHNLISHKVAAPRESIRERNGGSRSGSDFTVQMKRDSQSGRSRFSANASKLVAFGLDVFLTAFRRGRFDFKDEDIIARLEPLVAVIGETLYSEDALVAMGGVKASAAIVKCPLRSVDKTLPVFIRRLLNLIKKSGSLDAGLAQASLKSLAIILRDCGKAVIGENDLKYLLELISPELEDPNRQSVAFTLLRAIVARQFIAPEIYDLMGRVSDIMVTNQSTQVQELCRGVLLQFLLDYPQGKGRLRQQMTFLASNLSYVYESGRRSVMELLSAVLEKFQADLIREYADLLFVSLVMSLVNDDSICCREMAAELLKKVFGRLEPKQQQVAFTRLHSWMAQADAPQLPRVAAQVYGLLVDQSQQSIEPLLPALFEDLVLAITRSAAQFALLEDPEDDAIAMDTDVDWQLPYHALTIMGKLLRLFPTLSQSSTLPWEAIVSLFLFPHAWVRLAAARVAGLVLTSTPIPANGLPSDDFPISMSSLIEITRLSALQLRSVNLDSELCMQIVKNLLFVGKCFSRVKRAAPTEPADDESDSEEEADDVPEKNILENPLAWLFSKLSHQLRRSHAQRRRLPSGFVGAGNVPNDWSLEPTAILQFFAAMASHLDRDALEPFLLHILSPVYRLLDDDTTKDKGIDELKTLCQELQDMLQQKLGATTFSNVYNVIRQRVLEVRRQRKTTRVMQANTEPEAAARYKIKRNVMKSQNRKRKAGAHADFRGRIGGTKKRRTD